MGERILRDRLETLKMKDLDKFDRAAIVLLCIHGVSAHGVYGDIYNHNFKGEYSVQRDWRYGIKNRSNMQLAEYPRATTELRFL